MDENLINTFIFAMQVLMSAASLFLFALIVLRIGKLLLTWWGLLFLVLLAACWYVLYSGLTPTPIEFIQTHLTCGSCNA